MRTSTLACAMLAILVGSAVFGRLGPLDLARAAEVERLLTAHAAEVWPGWGPQPLLLRSGGREYLVAHPAPPRGFSPLGDAARSGVEVFATDDPLTPAPIATSWRVGEVWSVAIPVLNEFQAAIDEVLGAGVVTLDDPSYIRAVIHEAFHAFQLDTYGGPDALPRANEAVDEREVLARLRTVATLNDWHARQGRALARALSAETVPEMVEAARTFLEERVRWRGVAPPATRALERQIEWTEGLARYADTAVMLSLDPNGAAEDAGLEPYPDPEATREAFLSQLENPATIPGGLRDRYSLLGAAQGFVLDELMPAWKTRALPGGAALEDLLAEAVAGFETAEFEAAGFEAAEFESAPGADPLPGSERMAPLGARSSAPVRSGRPRTMDRTRLVHGRKTR